MLPLVRIGPLEAALARGLGPQGDLRRELEPFADAPLQSGEESLAVAKAIVELARRGVPELTPTSPVLLAAGLLQEVASPEALDPVTSIALPVLVKVYDEHAPRDAASAERLDSARVAGLLFLLKLFAMFGERAGVERIIAAAQLPLAPADEMWAVVFHQIGADHPHRHAFVGRLLDPLPSGVIGLAHLDLANRLAGANEFVRHPYDDAAGWDRLRSLLQQTSAPHGSITAAAALAFIKPPAADELLGWAAGNPDPRTRLEAAWAAAKLGAEAGVETLRGFCLQPIWSRRASDYLKELGLEQAIPAEARDPRFAALAEFSAWLAHPLEFGRPPDEAELIGEATLTWPPTNDVRTLRLFRYRYNNAGAEPFISLGLVGSITFSLRIPAETPPDDVLALHCCWELAATRDPRAPQKLSVEFGRNLIENAQPRRPG
ncbi:MAG TPA: HEAT repeat domain-containing protein [Pirellulales bacterium]